MKISRLILAALFLHCVNSAFATGYVYATVQNLATNGIDFHVYETPQNYMWNSTVNPGQTLNLSYNTLQDNYFRGKQLQMKITYRPGGALLYGPVSVGMTSNGLPDIVINHVNTLYGGSAPPQNTNCVVVGSVRNPSALSVNCTWVLLSGPSMTTIAAGVKTLTANQWWTPSWATNGAGCPLRFEYVLEEGPSGSVSSTNWVTTNAVWFVNTNVPITSPNIIEANANIPDNSPPGTLGGSTNAAVTQADARLNTAATIGAGAQQSSNAATRISMSVSNAVDRRPGDYVEDISEARTNFPGFSSLTNHPGLSAMWNAAGTLAGQLTNAAGQALNTTLGPGFSGVSTGLASFYSAEEAPSSFWRFRFKGGLTAGQASSVKFIPGDANTADPGFDMKRWFTGLSDMIPNFNNWLRWFFVFIEIVILFASILEIVTTQMNRLLATGAGASGSLSTGPLAAVWGQAGASALLALALTTILLMLPSLITVLASVWLSFVTSDLSGTLTYLAANPTKANDSTAFSFRAIFAEMNMVLPLKETIIFAANYWIVKQISDFSGILGRLAYKILSMFA